MKCVRKFCRIFYYSTQPVYPFSIDRHQLPASFKRETRHKLCNTELSVLDQRDWLWAKEVTLSFAVKTSPHPEHPYKASLGCAEFRWAQSWQSFKLWFQKSKEYKAPSQTFIRMISFTDLQVRSYLRVLSQLNSTVTMTGQQCSLAFSWMS